MSVLIIAEAGVNHNGDIKIAKELVDVAAETGCDAVKFQTFTAEALTTKGAEKAAYQRKKGDNSGGQLEMLKKLELTHEQHLTLIDHCKYRGIEFLSTAFDVASIDMLATMKLKRYLLAK